MLLKDKFGPYLEFKPKYKVLEELGPSFAILYLDIPKN